jgi:hypothetical protein
VPGPPMLFQVDADGGAHRYVGPHVRERHGDARDGVPPADLGVREGSSASRMSAGGVCDRVACSSAMNS